MKCPECNSVNLKITDSRYYDKGLMQNTKKRKRRCKDCDHTFFSFELCFSQEEIEKVLNALQQPKWKAHWKDEEDRELIKLHNKGYRAASIAVNLGRSLEAVRKRISILGLSEAI